MYGDMCAGIMQRNQTKTANFCQKKNMTKYSMPALLKLIIGSFSILIMLSSILYMHVLTGRVFYDAETVSLNASLQKESSRSTAHLSV
jgi:hypothetical protein